MSDGWPVGNGMRITIAPDPSDGHGNDSQTVSIAPDGRFEFAGLRSDTYAVFASVRGYRLNGPSFGIAAKMDRDVSDLSLSLDPMG